MLRTRVIPALLLQDGGLVKTLNFAKPKYVGDPINAVRIFNEKEVDELILMDITASRAGREPDYALISDIVSEAFMPIGYGGGVRTLAQAQRLVSSGIEKISFNSAALDGWDVVAQAAARLGSSSTLVSIDVNRDWRGRYRVYDARTRSNLKRDLMAYLAEAVDAGAGEIFINDVSRDGTGKGYDLDLIAKICSAVDVPVIICGGAGELAHLRQAADVQAAGVAAGSLFVYMGKHRAVMINYPSQKDLKGIFHD
jgi:imidazole glycerol-phosphate synthase subunit HisF